MALQNDFYTGEQGGKVSPTILSLPNITTGGMAYMAKLGEYMFSLDTSAFQELGRSTEFSWVMLPRIGRKPAAQFVGYGEDTIELSGVIYPHFRGGLGQMESMRTIAGTGKALPLIFAFQRVGQYNGLWCIKSIRETRREFFHDGTCRKIEFSIALTAYGEDAGATSEAVVSVASAAGSVQTTQIAQPALIAETTGLQVVQNDTVIGGLELWTVDGAPTLLSRIAGTLGTVTSTAVQLVNKAESMLDGIIKGDIESTVLSLIPTEAQQAVKDVFAVAELVAEVSGQSGDQFAFLKDNGSALKDSARKYENDLLQARRQFVQYNSILQKIAYNLGREPSTIGVADADRLVSAASVRNATTATDQLIFAMNETARQVALLGSKINV